MDPQNEYNNNGENDGFVKVIRNIKLKKSSIKKNLVLEKKMVIERIKNILNKYHPYAAYLYGSTARGENKENSDIDLFVIWKKIPKDEIIQQIYNKLYLAFNRRIDFVNYQYNGKSIKITSTDTCYIKNVIDDAVSIIEPNNKGMVIKDIYFDYDYEFDS